MNTYKFVQNNSGGYYVGPAEFVVRAESVDGAWAELKNQEWFTTDFCECCGERWYNPEVLEPIKEGNMNWNDIASVDRTDTELKELRFTVKSLQDTVRDLKASLEIEQMLNRALMKKVQRFENV
jgi:hypothetical protein